MKNFSMKIFRMKRFLLVAIMALGIMAPLTACGSEKESDSTGSVADTVIEMNSQKDKTKEALQNMENTAVDIDAVGQDLLD